MSQEQGNSGRPRRAAVVMWLHLVRIQQKIGRRAMAQLAEYELTPAQFDVLAHLRAAPGNTQQVLADSLLVTKGNVCGLIDRLVTRGLVERRADPEDRRANLLFLTETGAELADEVVPAHEALIEEQMERLGVDERRALGRLLRQFDRALDRG
jgi:DNA-binding MarR family transcriptional regulator